MIDGNLLAEAMTDFGSRCGTQAILKMKCWSWFAGLVCTQQWE